MKLYRNLGRITYESQTNSFEIFAAEPNTTIFQFQSQQIAQSLLQQLSSLYAPSCQLTCYSEPLKCSSLLLKHSKKVQVKNSDTSKVCLFLSEAANTIRRISQFITDQIGDCTIHQYRWANEKLVFIYIPTTKVENEEERQSLKLKNMLGLANQIVNQKDSSQKLLIKKLTKCTNIEEFIQEVNYFESVYCIGKTKVNHEKQVIQRPLERSILLGNIKYLNKPKNKSHRKCTLFKLDLSKIKKQSSSQHFASNSYLSEQQRQMSCTMQLTSSMNKKFNSTYFTNRRPSVNSHSRVKKSNLLASGISDQNSGKKSGKNMVQSRMIDDDQLLEKIRNKNRLKNRQIFQDQKIEEPLVEHKGVATYFPKIEQETQTISTQNLGSKSMNKVFRLEEMKTMKEQGTTMTDLLKELKSNTSEKYNVELMPLNDQAFRLKQEDVKRSIRASIQEQTYANHKSKPETVKIPKQNDPKIKSPLKQPPKLERLDKLPHQQLPKKRKQQIIQKLQEEFKPQEKPKIVEQPKNVEKHSSKKNVKKAHLFSEEQIGSQLQIIDLKTKPKPSTSLRKEAISPPSKLSKQIKKPQVQQSSQAQKKPFHKPDKSVSQPSTQSMKQQILLKYNKLNLMGTAVANTTTYLAKYDKIFWQLPMYFIYRGFYMKRRQITKQAEDTPVKKLLDFQKILAENDKIKELVSKLIKKINSKLKKDKPDLFQTLKPYLNLQEQVSCDEIMKQFLKEYIESLSAATGKDEKLLMHLLQIIDAYLIYCGEDINQQIRAETIKSTPSIKKYVMGQTTLLNSYL